MTGRVSEATRVFGMAEFYREALMSGKRDLLRLKVLRTYRSYSCQARQIFLHVSTEGINDPDKAFKLTNLTFKKFLKETGIYPLLSTPATAEIIFTKCNSVDFEQAPRDDKNVKGAKPAADEEEDRTLEMDEFVESLLRLAADLFPDVGDAADRLKTLIETHLLPYMSKTEPGVDAGADEEDVAMINDLLDTHEVKLKKLFKFYCSAGGKGGGADTGGGDDVSCYEFLQLCKECRMASLGLSFTKCLDTFIDCNEEEVQGFINGTLTEDLTEAMQMDWDEFRAAMQTLVLKIPIPARAKKEKVFGDFFTQIFANCPHYHLNLVEIT